MAEGTSGESRESMETPGIPIAYNLSTGELVHFYPYSVYSSVRNMPSFLEAAQNRMASYYRIRAFFGNHDLPQELPPDVQRDQEIIDSMCPRRPFGKSSFMKSIIESAES